MSPDTGYAVAAAGAYQVPPPGVLVIDCGDVRAIVTGNLLAVRGTRPTEWNDWRRDMEVGPERSKLHPILGVCDTGALDAAQAIFDALPPEVRARPLGLAGHSLGGQIITPLAGLLALGGVPPMALVPFDPPKAASPELVALLATAKVPVRVYRFRGSIVTHWPVDLYLHPGPRIDIEDWIPDIVEAHSIDRAAAWMLAQPPLA